MTHHMTRKQFGGALLGGTVLLLIQSCGGGGGSDSYGGSGSPVSGGAATGCNDTIAANHGHVLTIAAADLDSTTGKTYDIYGTADHTHSVTLTAANLASLKSHATVVVTTTVTLAHSHEITISCL
jgi:hypothetical protein